MGEIVSVELGGDIFAAEVIAAACTAAGLHAQLVRNEHPATGALHAVQPAFLLVAAQDLAKVEEIVARSR